MIWQLCSYTPKHFILAINWIMKWFVRHGNKFKHQWSLGIFSVSALACFIFYWRRFLSYWSWTICRTMTRMRLFKILCCDLTSCRKAESGNISDKKIAWGRIVHLVRQLSRSWCWRQEVQGNSSAAITHWCLMLSDVGVLIAVWDHNNLTSSRSNVLIFEV